MILPVKLIGRLVSVSVSVSVNVSVSVSVTMFAIETRACLFPYIVLLSNTWHLANHYRLVFITFTSNNNV